MNESSVGELIDRRALVAYRQRIIDLDQELDEATDWADEERVTRLSAERVALIEEISAATGLGGRSRYQAATAERARVAVRKAVAAAIDRISDTDPLLGRILRDGIRTGSMCRYEADPSRPIEWVTDQPRNAEGCQNTSSSPDSPAESSSAFAL